jgi:hypothetical protein
MTIPSIAAALVLVTACAVQTPPEMHTPAFVPGELVKGKAAAPAALAECRIRETPTAKGFRLEAVVEAGDAVYGDYEFTVTAKGSAGSSDLSQAGPISLAAGKHATVGSAEFSGRRYRALLSLTDAEGELCSAESLS